MFHSLVLGHEYKVEEMAPGTGLEPARANTAVFETASMCVVSICINT